MTRAPGPGHDPRRRRWMARPACLVAVLLAGAPPARAAPDPLIAGVVLPDAAGLPRPLHDGRAAATLVDFWASWCTPCRQSFPWMNGLHDALAPRGLRIVAVNLDTRRDDADRFLARHPARFEVLYDPAGDSARRLALRAMPSSLLLDAGGRILGRHAGFRPSEADALAARVRAALPPA